MYCRWIDSLIEICKKRQARSEYFFYYDWDFNWNFFKDDLFRCQPITIDLKTLLAYQSYFIVRIELINFILPNVNFFLLKLTSCDIDDSCVLTSADQFLYLEKIVIQFIYVSLRHRDQLPLLCKITNCTEE